MKTSFDLAEKLKKLSENVETKRKKLRKEILRAAEDSCEVMVQTAKNHTPHEGDGKRRGFNVISNSLQDSWSGEVEKSSNPKTIGKVTLKNKKKYAVYVQNGHKVARHFVPWLYKDDLGTISYETDHGQPMFGLVVGTKTPYVKGVDMVGPAIEAFDKSFEENTEKLISKIFNGKPKKK